MNTDPVLFPCIKRCMRILTLAVAIVLVILIGVTAGGMAGYKLFYSVYQ